MASIDLPRPLQDYFAFAETTPTRHGRRFSITLPYVRPDGRLDRLQWWYHLSPAKEKAMGDHAPDTLRAEAIGRFSLHIARWLQNTRQELFGEGAIPQVCAQGNRIVGAYRVDTSASAGLAQNNESADSVAHVPAINDAVVDEPAVDDPAGNDPAAGEVAPPQGDHVAVNKAAFG